MAPATRGRGIREPLRHRPAPWLIFLGLSVVGATVFALTRSSAVMLTIEIGVCVASTLVLGAGWLGERRRAPQGDPLVGLAFAAVLVSTLATGGFAAGRPRST